MPIFDKRTELIEENNEVALKVSEMTKQQSKSQGQSMTREERLAKRKTAKSHNREALKALRTLIMDITEELSLDEEKMERRLDSAFQSEYGPINGTINLLCSIANWPAEAGDGSAVSANKRILEEKFSLDLMMLADIRQARGFHTFVTDDLEILPGTPPIYQDYADDCEIFLEEQFNIQAHKPTIDKTTWERTEARAKAKAEEELERMKAEIERHRDAISNHQ